MIGGDRIRRPYTSQKKTPSENNRYIKRERLRVFLVRKTLMTCGRNDRVVNAPARNPIVSTVPLSTMSVMALFRGKTFVHAYYAWKSG